MQPEDVRSLLLEKSDSLAKLFDLAWESGLTPEEIAEEFVHGEGDAGAVDDADTDSSDETGGAELPAAPPADHGRLKSIVDISNVGGLAAGCEYEINDRLTVIWGPNGTGKTTLSRLCRRAALARGSEPVEANIFDATPGVPSAKFIFASADPDAADVERPWSEGDGAAMPLRVFDRAYAEPFFRGNSLEFRPPLLDALKSVVDAIPLIQELTRQDHDRERKSWMSKEPRLAGREDAAVDYISSLLVDAVITDDDNDTSTGDHISSLRQQAELLEDRKYLIDVEGSIELFFKDLSASHAELEKLVDEQQAPHDRAVALKAASRERLERLQTDVILTVAEQDADPDLAVAVENRLRIVEAAETYQAGISTLAFPGVQGDPCLACARPYDETSFDHVQKLVEVLHSTEVADIAKLTGDSTRIHRALEDLWSGMDRLLDADPIPHELAEAAHSVRALREAGTLTVEELRRERDAALKLRDEIRDRQIARTEILERTRAAIDWLEDRAWFETALRADSKNIERLGIAAAAVRLARGLDGGVVTRVVTKISDELVKKSFVDKFVTAVGLFDLPRPGIELAWTGSRGDLKLSIKINGAQRGSIGKILSEGERTAIAMACFLAELDADASDAAILFDDPATSLDESVRTVIGDVLVDLASRRQVIVLTHDLVVVSEITHKADSVPLEFLSAALRSEPLGHRWRELPWGGFSIGKKSPLRKRLTASVDAVRGGATEDARRSHISNFYNELRGAWERVTEIHVLNGTVQRLSVAVQTQRMKSVVVDDDVVTRLHAAMGRASKLIKAHQTAPGLQLGFTPTVTPEAMEADLDELDSFLTDLTAKQSATKASRPEVHAGSSLTK